MSGFALHTNSELVCFLLLVTLHLFIENGILMIECTVLVFWVLDGS